jgi:hypothetical protein
MFASLIEWYGTLRPTDKVCDQTLSVDRWLHTANFIAAQENRVLEPDQ